MSPADPDYYPRIKIRGEEYLVAHDLKDQCRHCAFFCREGLIKRPGVAMSQCDLQIKGEYDEQRFRCGNRDTVFIKPDKLPEYVAVVIERRME